MHVCERVYKYVHARLEFEFRIPCLLRPMWLAPRHVIVPWYPLTPRLRSIYYSAFWKLFYSWVLLIWYFSIEWPKCRSIFITHWNAKTEWYLCRNLCVTIKQSLLFQSNINQSCYITLRNYFKNLVLKKKIKRIVQKWHWLFLHSSVSVKISI